MALRVSNNTKVIVNSVYNPSPEQDNWSENGNDIYNNNTGGKVGINTQAPAYTLDVSTQDISGLRVGNVFVDAFNNRISIGKETSATSGFFNNYGVRIVKEGSSGSTAALQIYRNQTGSTSAPKIEFLKTQGTFETPTANVAGTSLGSIASFGYNNIRATPGYFDGPSIVFQQDGDVSSGLNGAESSILFVTRNQSNGNINNCRMNSTKNQLGKPTLIQDSASNLSPHPKALLDLVSTTQGFMPPRMTPAQATALFPSPDATAAGLMIYVNNIGSAPFTTTGWYGYNGSTWEKLNN
jgi:hypothetical protein